MENRICDIQVCVSVMDFWINLLICGVKVDFILKKEVKWDFGDKMIPQKAQVVCLHILRC